MLAGLRVLWRGTRALIQCGYACIWANVAWAILSLPLITMPAATAAIMETIHTLRAGPSLEFEAGELWSAFKRHLGRATAFGLGCVAVLGIALYNWWAYRDESGILISTLRAIWAVAIATWGGAMLYTWPLLLRQEDQRVTTALRNALIMTATNPAFTLTLLAGVAIAITLSTLLVIPWGLITMSWIASLADEAVGDRLKHARHRAR